MVKLKIIIELGKIVMYVFGHLLFVQMTIRLMNLHIALQIIAGLKENDV